MGNPRYSAADLALKRTELEDEILDRIEGEALADPTSRSARFLAFEFGLIRVLEKAFERPSAPQAATIRRLAKGGKPSVREQWAAMFGEDGS
jgi:hypothetical protein